MYNYCSLSQDILECRRYLRTLNGRASTGVALVLFIVGNMATLCEGLIDTVHLYVCMHLAEVIHVYVCMYIAKVDTCMLLACSRPDTE